MSEYLPVRALNRSQNVRLGQGSKAVKLTHDTTSYVDITDGNVKRDLQRHAAIGAYVVVGPLTATKVDPVVWDGAVTTATPSALSVDVSAGTLKNRQTGVTVDVPATAGVATAVPAAGKSKIYAIVADNTTGAVTAVGGTAANTGLEVAPATPGGQTLLAYVDVVHTDTAVDPSEVTDARPRP